LCWTIIRHAPKALRDRLQPTCPQQTPTAFHDACGKPALSLDKLSPRIQDRCSAGLTQGCPQLTPTALHDPCGEPASNRRRAGLCPAASARDPVEPGSARLLTHLGEQPFCNDLPAWTQLLTVCRCHGKRGGRPLAVNHLNQGHALPDVDGCTAVVWEPTLPAMPEHAGQRAFRSSLGHRQTVRGSAGVGLRDRRKHGCFLRAYKDVFTACPADPHPTAQARYVRKAGLFAQMHEAAGQSPAPRK